MKITYDQEVDVLYIRFRETRVASRHVDDHIVLDYDADDRLAGIEILDASAILADPAALDGASYQKL